MGVEIEDRNCNGFIYRTLLNQDRGSICPFTRPVINTTVVHAGYHFPFVYPSPEHHDFHHEAFTSNFGVTGLCDWFYGTDAAFKARGRARLHRVLFSFAPLPRKR